MPELFSAIACNLDVNILSAAYPLLEEGKVEAIEWSFDALYKRDNIPGWFEALLQAYSENGRLAGHGVFFSVFSGRWLPAQEAWLRHLRHTAALYKFDHITEHFGFMTGKDFHHGAPLSIPYTTTTLSIGRDRLARICDACQCPVGLENLAFSYCAEEVKRHGEFLEKLVAPVNGFIILDLHNLYCQSHNFDIAPEELMALHPLHLVREIHISGGSWEDSIMEPQRKVRRDTHDDGVPAEVFNILQYAIPLCPSLKFVVLEQLGTGLQTEQSRRQFATDFLTMQHIVKANATTAPATRSFLPGDLTTGMPAEDSLLYSQQLELSAILETATDQAEAAARLQQSSLANTEWRVENWAPYMLETAVNIARKWKK